MFFFLATPALVAQGAPDALFAANRFADAIDAARTLALTDPKAALTLVRALLRLDRWEEALAEAEAATARFAEDADLRAFLSLAEFRAGMPERAQASAKAALAREPQSYWALVAQASFLSQWMDDDDGARKLLRSAVKLRPAEVEGQWLLLQTLEDPKEGRALASALLAMKPKGHPYDEYLSDLNTLVEASSAMRRLDKEIKASRARLKRPDVVKLPLTMAMGMIFVDVDINGKTIRLLFDTGASNALVLDRDKVALVRPKFVSKTLLRGVQGKEESRLMRASAVTLGPISFGSLPLRESADTPMCDGIFGAALLSDYAITLDFALKEMVLRKVKGGKAVGSLPTIPNGRAHVLPLKQAFGGNLYTGLRLVSPVAPGAKSFSLEAPLWSIVDTGAQAGLVSLRLAAALSSGLSAADVRNMQNEAPVGIGSSKTKMDIVMFRRPFALVGPDSLVRPVPYGIGASPLDRVISPGTGFETGAILGMPFLMSYPRVTFDYPNKKLILETGAPQPPVPAAPDPLGNPAAAPAAPAGEGKVWVFVASAASWTRMDAGAKLIARRTTAPFLIAPGYIALRDDKKSDWWLVPAASQPAEDGAFTVQENSR